MKKKMAIMLVTIMLLNASGVNVYGAEELVSDTEIQREYVTQPEEDTEKTTDVKQEDNTKKTTETQQEGTEKTTDVKQEDNTKKTTETQPEDNEQKVTETQQTVEKAGEESQNKDKDTKLIEDTENAEDAEELDEETLKEWIFGDIDELPDDPGYLKMLEEGKKLLNDPSVLSFGYNGYQHNDRFANCTIRNGIDVSYYQGTIDWNAVRNSGIEYVFIRVGYRGYSQGTLNVDPKAAEYLRGASSAGLKVGAYMFSQALTEQEAREEAQFALNQIAGYHITMPVVIDYEYASTSNGVGGRLYNAHISREQATANVNAFCSYIQSSGYVPMVYANKSMLEYSMNAGNIPYKIWLANYTSSTTYQGNYEFWQYSSSGYVNGINSRVDCDFWYDAGTGTRNEYTRTIDDGVYRIESALGAEYLVDVNGGGSDDCANIQLWKGNQTFKVTYLGGGKYSLMSTCSGKYIDAENGGNTQGTNVLQYSWNNAENQKWYIQDVGNGYYYIRSAVSELCMDVEGGAARNGANILLWGENGGNNQKFKFVKQMNTSQRPTDSGNYTQTITDGTYKIESALGNGFLLDVNGGVGNNCANIQIWKGGQTFQVKYLGNGKYSLMASCSGKYVDADNGGRNNGTNILQYEWNGGENQKWYIQDAGNGYYYIMSAQSGLRLDVCNGEARNGANVLLWSAHDGNNQKFRFVSAQGGSTTGNSQTERTIADGTYEIESALGSGLLLDIYGGTNQDCANLQIWRGSQRFKVTYLGSGKYALIATCSGKYLDAEQGGTAKGTNVIQYHSNGGENQKWYIQDAGNGYYYIVSAQSGLRLDVGNGEARSGANVLLWSAHSGNNQKFKFKRVG